MDKYYTGDRARPQEISNDDYWYESPLTLDLIKEYIHQASVFAEIETIGKKAIVRVMDNTGTSMYYAKALDDYFFFNRRASKKEKKGSVTVYTFKLS